MKRKGKVQKSSQSCAWRARRTRFAEHNRGKAGAQVGQQADQLFSVSSAQFWKIGVTDFPVQV